MFAALAAVAMAGCSRAYPTEPAEFATDPACSRVLVDLRGTDTLLDAPRREVTAQATAAWGDGEVVLRCGLAPLGPTTDPCFPVAGVDWVVREEGGRTYFTSYGRRPAVEVSVPGKPQSADALLGSLSPAVATLAANGRTCK